MKNRITFTLMSALLLFLPTSVLAHNVKPGTGLIGVLLHPFTGDHLLMLALVAVSIVVYYILRHRFPDK